MAAPPPSLRVKAVAAQGADTAVELFLSTYSSRIFGTVGVRHGTYGASVPWRSHLF